MGSELICKCRTCLNESSVYHQLHDIVEEFEVLEMLDGIVPQIEIKTSSKFSTLMCQTCVDKLLTSYKFQQLCIDSNNRLRDLLSTALFQTQEPEKLNSLREESIVQVKQEIVDVAPEREIEPLEEEREMLLDNDNDGVIDGEIDSDSSDEQLSLLKEKLVKDPSLKNEHFENFNQVKQDLSEHSTVCTICDKDFRYNSKLKEHMRKHSGECPYLCTQCGKRFRRLRGLQYHISVHNDEKPYSCSQCGKSFRGISYFREHMARHTGVRKFQCPDCPSRFYRISDLKRHCSSDKVHLKITNYKRPSKLQIYYNENFEMQEHSVNDNKEGECQDYNIEPDMDESELVKSTERFQETNDAKKEKIITVKSQIFEESMDDFDDDAECISNDQGDSEDNSEKMLFSKLEANESTKAKRIGGHYSCETCGKVFDKEFRLKRHSSVHSLARPHICEICNYRFSSPKTLKGHLSKHKNGTVRNSKHLYRNKDKIKPVCSICGKEFANNYNLKEHMRLHSGEKPFQCAQCGKTFRYSSAMKEHMRTHSGENPYQCNYCGQTFRFSSSYNRHKEKHMSLKTYQCPECPSRFKCTLELTNHRTKLHSRVANLKRLLKQPELNGPYSCEICYTSLTSEKCLEAHMLMHTNDEIAHTHKSAQQNNSIEENDCNDVFEIQEFLELPTINDKGEKECSEQKPLLSAHYKVHKQNNVVKITQCKNIETDMQHNEVINSTNTFQEKMNEAIEEVVVKEEEVEDTSQMFQLSIDKFNNDTQWRVTNDYENPHTFKEPMDNFKDDEKWISNDYEDPG